MASKTDNIIAGLWAKNKEASDANIAAGDAVSATLQRIAIAAMNAMLAKEEGYTGDTGDIGKHVCRLRMQWANVPDTDGSFRAQASKMAKPLKVARMWNETGSAVVIAAEKHGKTYNGMLDLLGKIMKAKPAKAPTDSDVKALAEEKKSDTPREKSLVDLSNAVVKQLKELFERTQNRDVAESLKSFLHFREAESNTIAIEQAKKAQADRVASDAAMLAAINAATQKPARGKRAAN